MAEARVADLVQQLSAGLLSRRRFIRRALGLGLSAPAIAALLAQAPSPASAAPRAGAASGARRFQADATTLVIADNLKDTWIWLDPAHFYEINSAAAMNVVLETLYALPDSTKPTEFVPLLAEGMPEVSADGLQATIKLRSGVTFHNSGNPMTADDVIFSWNRLKNVLDQGSFLAIDYWDAVEKVDDLTIKIVLKAPNVALVPILSSYPLSITDSAVTRENGGLDDESAAENDTAADWWNEGNSAGTGPFRLTAWDIEGEVVVERFAEYWGDAPALERIIWRNVTDPNTQLQLVETGEADIAYSLDPDAAVAVKEAGDLQVLTGPTLAHEYLALHTQEDPGGPVATKELRQAIGYAIDYQGIIDDLLKGAGIKPATIVPEPLLGSEAVREFGYTTDLARAQELFDGTGLGEVELTLTYGAGGQGEGGLALETLVPKLQADLQQVNGLTVALNPMDAAKRLEDFRNGKLQFTISGWSPDYPDVHTYAEPFGRTNTAAAKRVGYSNPEVDAALDAGIAETDPAKREQLYVDIQKRLIEDAPFLVLYQPIDQKAASKAVQGAATHSVAMIQLRGVSKTA